ncbi:MAG: radical SAM protein [Polyangiales bacterium]
MNPVRRLLPVIRGAAGLSFARLRGHRRPYSITFILTHRCNFRCDYCDIPDAAAFEMSTAQFCDAIDQLAAAGMSRASFSGGEVLLRPDSLEIIGHAKKRGLFTSMNTNGWLVEENIDAIARVLDMMVVSVDGPAETHDRVRNRRRSHERVVSAIELARARGIAVATITVLSKTNLHVIDDVLGLAEKHGFWAYFQPAYRDCFDHGAGLEPELSAEVLQSIARDLSAARAAGRPVAASSTFLERLARGPNFGDCGSCYAGKYFGSVMPDGTVVPCHLVSSHARFPNGLELGFANAFEQMVHPTEGPGCAISPYQESDLIFGLDAGAIGSAFQRMLGAPR